MKKFISILLALMIAVPVFAADAKKVADVSVDVASTYLWRHLDVHEAANSKETGIEPALQPSLTLYTPIKGLTLGLWGSEPIGEDASALEGTREVNYLVDYATGVGFGDLLTGFTHYRFPSDKSLNSNEVYVGLDTSLVLDVTVKYFMSTGADGTSYLATTLGYTWDVGAFSFGINGTYGYAEDVQHVTVSAPLDCAISEDTSISFTPTYLVPIAEDVSTTNKLAGVLGVTHSLRAE